MPEQHLKEMDLLFSIIGFGYFVRRYDWGGGVAMLTPSEKPVFPDNNLHVEES